MTPVWIGSLVMAIVWRASRMFTLSQLVRGPTRLNRGSGYPADLNAPEPTNRLALAWRCIARGRWMSACGVPNREPRREGGGPSGPPVRLTASWHGASTQLASGGTAGCRDGQVVTADRASTSLGVITTAFPRANAMAVDAHPERNG